MNNQDSLKQSNLNYRQISKLEIVIEALEKRLTTLENKITAMISLYKDAVIDQSYLEKRIRKLEQQDSDYPNKEEISKIKIGGTD